MSEEGLNEITKNEKDKERKQKIKNTCSGVIALIVLFASMLSTLGDLVVKYGKGSALWYLVLWLWAFDHFLDKDTKSKRISQLELENKLLKKYLETHKNVNKELGEELKDI